MALPCEQQPPVLGRIAICRARPLEVPLVYARRTKFGNTRVKKDTLRRRAGVAYAELYVVRIWAGTANAFFVFSIFSIMLRGDTTWSGSPTA
jgi:hypothetical protein